MAGWRRDASLFAAGATRFTTPAAEGIIGSERNVMNAYFTNSSQAEGYLDERPIASQDLDLQGAKSKEMPEVLEVVELLTFGSNWNELARILPYQKTDRLKIEEHRLTFFPTFALKQAERTRPRTVQHKSTTIQSYLENYAIGFEMPFSLATTAKGRLIYETGLQQMKNAMMETSSMAILNELQTYVICFVNFLTPCPCSCFSPWRKIEGRYGTVKGRALVEILDLDRKLAGLFQKEDNPWEALDNTISAIQKTFRAKGPATYICPEVLKTFTTIAIPRQTEYFRGGPEAIARVHGGPDSLRSDGRGNDIITMVSEMKGTLTLTLCQDSFTVENQPPLDLLKKYVTYGE
jgi:hypothetical protein